MKGNFQNGPAEAAVTATSFPVCARIAAQRQPFARRRKISCSRSANLRREPEKYASNWNFCGTSPTAYANAAEGPKGCA